MLHRIFTLPSFLLCVGLALVTLCDVVSAGEVSVPFDSGFIGTTGQNTGKADDVLGYETLGVMEATFSQESQTGQFGGTQGNDLSGILRLYMVNGRVLSIPGALNWRITVQGDVIFFGFIPDPGNQPLAIGYPGGLYVLDGSRNYGTRLIGRAYTFSDGDDLSGNAATSGLVNALNTYLAEVGGMAPVITGPSGTSGATESIVLGEGKTEVGVFSANESVSWSIEGGLDAGLFVIDQATGRLSFVAPPDADVPMDADRDNVYLVSVRAMDPEGYFHTMQVAVTVVQQPEISVVKSIALVSDPMPGFDCATAEPDPSARVHAPGSCVLFTVDVSSAPNGSDPVLNLQVTDDMPTGLHYVSTLSQAGFDAIVVDGEKITGSVGVFPAGATASVSFRAVIE